LAGITHSDVDHLMIYDAFAHLPIYGLEYLGFVPRGEAGDFIAGHNTAPGGKLSLNTVGGGLSYIADGLSNKAAARRLGISQHTVKFHVESLFRKLGAVSRADAVRKGLRQRLFEI
jgi:acetyl-CoA acetyltransferase